jgi:hypothetical protein
MEWAYLLALTQEGAYVECDFHSGETLVWMFYGLGNHVEDFMVISWLDTYGSVHRAKWRLILTEG